MKRKLKKWWPTISPILSKRTITSHLNLLNTKTPPDITSEIQVLRWDKHKNCGEVKPVKIIYLSCAGMDLYNNSDCYMWQKIGTVILLYNRKVMTIPNELFILNDPPYIDNYKQNISVVICDTNYPLWWWWSQDFHFLHQEHNVQ